MRYPLSLAVMVCLHDSALIFLAVADTRMSDEIVHNLDGCEISLVGDDLDPERERLLLDGASLQQRGLELINTSAYLTIAGGAHPLRSSSLSSISLPFPHIPASDVVPVLKSCSFFLYLEFPPITLLLPCPASLSSIAHRILFKDKLYALRGRGLSFAYVAL